MEYMQSMMSGAFNPGERHGKCVNCENFDWEQPEDKSTILKCSKCKMIYYCSKQCQQEHWEKVHKKHCRYMAETKVLAKSWHDESTCLVCREVTEDMSKPDSPVLPCTMALANQGMMKTCEAAYSPGLPLAEMTGQFRTKVEATVTIMMRILLKMRLTKHTVWDTDPSSAGKLYAMLGYVRRQCWICYRHA